MTAGKGREPLTSMIGLTPALSFFTHLLRRGEIRFAAGFLLKFVIWDSVRAKLPTWAILHWWLILIGLGFILCEVILVASVLPFPQLVSIYYHGSTEEKLGLARLGTAALTFLMAVVAAGLAIAEIRRAVARPDLRPTFEGLSPYLSIPFESRRGGSFDGVWTEIPFRVWNASDVTAHHFKVRLIFEPLGPFLLKMHSLSVHAGRWQHRHDLPGLQWEFRSDDSFKVYAHELAIIGHVHLELRPEIARDAQAELPHSHAIWIRAFLYDERGDRERILGLTLEPRRVNGPAPRDRAA